MWKVKKLYLECSVKLRWLLAWNLSELSLQQIQTQASSCWDHSVSCSTHYSQWSLLSCLSSIWCHSTELESGVGNSIVDDTLSSKILRNYRICRVWRQVRVWHSLEFDSHDQSHSWIPCSLHPTNSDLWITSSLLLQSWQSVEVVCVYSPLLQFNCESRWLNSDSTSDRKLRIQ